MEKIRTIIALDSTLAEQIENAKATATDGDYVEFISGRDTRAFEFFGTRFGVAINEFIPLEYSQRITGIMASGDAWYDYEVDNLASLTTKGWTYAGGWSDDAGGIILTSSSGAARYIKISITEGLPVLALAKFTPRTINGASNENMPAPYINVGSKVHRFIIGKSGDTSLNGIADSTTFRTQGEMGITEGQEVYCYADDYRVELSTTISHPSYNRKVGVNEASQIASYSANTVGVIAHAQTGNESSIQKLIFFSLN